jgi:hypothetical protein
VLDLDSPGAPAAGADAFATSDPAGALGAQR